MGGGSKSVKTKVERKIPPPSAEEQALLKDLVDMSTKDYYVPAPDTMRYLKYSYYRPSFYTKTLSYLPYSPSAFLRSAVAHVYRPGRFFWYSVGHYYKPSYSIERAAKEHYTLSPEAENLTEKYYTPTQEFVSEMKNPYLSALPYKEQIGTILNRMAQRGILNSSITQNALNQANRWLLEKALETRNRTLSQLEQARQASFADQMRRVLAREQLKQAEKESALKGILSLEQMRLASANDLWRRALGWEQMRQAHYNDLLRRALSYEQALQEHYEDMWRRALGIERLEQGSQADRLRRLLLAETLKRESLADRYNRLYRLWQTMYSGRLGTATTVTTQPVQSQWGQVIGQAVGTGLGYWLGPGGGFNKVASWGRDVLGSAILPFVPGSFV